MIPFLVKAWLRQNRQRCF